MAVVPETKSTQLGYRRDNIVASGWTRSKSDSALVMLPATKAFLSSTFGYIRVTSVACSASSSLRRCYAASRDADVRAGDQSVRAADKVLVGPQYPPQCYADGRGGWFVLLGKLLWIRLSA